MSKAAVQREMAHHLQEFARVLRRVAALDPAPQGAESLAGDQELFDSQAEELLQQASQGFESASSSIASIRSASVGEDRDRIDQVVERLQRASKQILGIEQPAPTEPAPTESVPDEAASEQPIPQQTDSEQTETEEPAPTQPEDAQDEQTTPQG